MKLKGNVTIQIISIMSLLSIAAEEELKRHSAIINLIKPHLSITAQEKMVASELLDHHK
jgi:hypothetical protein